MNSAKNRHNSQKQCSETMAGIAFNRELEDSGMKNN
jgi:hypothetical protein